MFEVLEASDLAPDVRYLRIKAPKIALRRKPGQFVIVRATLGRRADSPHHRRRRPRGGLDRAHLSGDRQDHAAVEYGGGRRPHPRRGRTAGHAIADRAGTATWSPSVAASGRRSPIRPRPPCKKAGNQVIAIIGGRSREHVILEEEMRAVCDEVYPTTDDGSYGLPRFRHRQTRDLIDCGPPIDLVLAIGPSPDDEGRGRGDPTARHQDDRQPQPDHGGRHRHVRRLPGRGRRRDEVRLRGRPRVRRPPRGLRSAEQAEPGLSRFRASAAWKSAEAAHGDAAGVSSMNELTARERMKMDRVAMPEQDPAARGAGTSRGQSRAHRGAGHRRGSALPAVPDPACVDGCPVNIQILDFIDCRRRRVRPGGESDQAGQLAAGHLRAGLPAGRAVRRRLACSIAKTRRSPSATWSGSSPTTSGRTIS